MKPIISLLFCLLISGCTTVSRWTTTASTTAAGGLIAHQVSDGNPLATAAGAGIGLAAGEGINVVNRKNVEAAYGKGFDKGRSDAVKQQYWIMVNQQRREEDPFSDEFGLFGVPLPEHQTNGVIYNPSTRRIQPSQTP